MRALLIVLLSWPGLTVLGQFDLVPDKAVPSLQESFLGTLPDEAFPAEQGLVAKVLDAEDDWVSSATIVRSDGWLLTKASDWPPEGRIQLSDGTVHAAEEVRQNITNDVALIHIDATDLPSLDLQASAEAEIGDWLVASRSTSDSRRLGVASALKRVSAREGGVIGVVMGRESGEGVQVAQVAPESGAAEAGVQVGDWLIKVNDQPVGQREEVQSSIQQHDPGSRIKVTIRREDEEQDLEILLGSRNVVFDLFNRNQLMSGPTSIRRSGFDEVLQHDLPMAREEVGIPLFDLDGRWVGINIARRNRVENFALSAEVVLRVVDELLTD